ncbi:MAG: FecR domain-containing protein [Verrucomicrobiae bacterium]|nr:FecR domain-containing protein [Verrucomicrobiae bacterium]
MSSHFSSPEQDLFQAYLEDRLTNTQRTVLDRRLRDDAMFRRRFADALHLEGVMHAEAAELFAESQSSASSVSVASAPVNRWLAAAAILAIGLALGWLLGPAFPLKKTNDQPGEVVETLPVAIPEPEPAPAPEPTPVVVVPELAEPVATLADVKSAKWGAGSLPTQEGSRLRQGQLELLEGLATLRFDSGATVTLEAPAVVEVETAMRCRLRRGAAVAWVPGGAHGFQIQTDDALLTDYGTRFGVTAGSDGKSEVLVLEGEVGVAHRNGSAERRLKTGEMIRYDAEKLVETVVAEGESPRFREEPRSEAEGWVSITTARGRGKDSYGRQNTTNLTYGDSPLLMVKNSTDYVSNRRKAWLTFDLRTIDKAKLTESQMILSIQPSGLGYASMVPDATFALYGLTDESFDESWGEDTLTWDNAPANVPDHGFKLDPEKTMVLGEFTVEQGVSSGLRSVDGQALTDFILSDTNDLVTFVLVRLTDETGSNGLVHAFASAEHPVAMPPTLRLKVQ